ncbi:MAG: hypothetical protein V7K90_10300 [Nostoc sp.]|uniref:hypothetical protein n=1 Tax=Nostoc sp. TaxID=1180 RepID=UPI002FFA8DC9
MLIESICTDGIWFMISALVIGLNCAIALVFHSTFQNIALSKENINYVQLQNILYWSSSDRLISGDWLHTNYSP